MHIRGEEREGQGPGFLFFIFKLFNLRVEDGTTSVWQAEGRMLITACLLPVLAPEKNKTRIDLTQFFHFINESHIIYSWSQGQCQRHTHTPPQKKSLTPDFLQFIFYSPSSQRQTD